MRKRWALPMLAALWACAQAGFAQQPAATVPQPKSDAELAKLFDRPVEGLETPMQKESYVYKGELTPAIVVRTRATSVRLFDLMAKFGLDGPTHAAYVSGGKVQVARRGELGALDESWLLVWFTGGAGWDKIRHSAIAQNNVKDAKVYAFDVPFLVSLQHKPSKVTVGPAGLELAFPGEAGIVQLMPLLGVEKPVPELTAAWEKGLPDAILQRARQWNARLKFIPVQVVERYAVDPGKDLVSLIHDFRFVAAPDDWKTPGTADAPIAPAIALAAEYGFPVRFSGKTLDAQSPTYFGPSWVIPGAKSVTIEVPGVLSLVTKVQVPNVDRAKDADLLGRIDGQLRGQLQATGMGWWAAASAAMEQGNKAALIPYATPATGELAKSAALRLMHENVFGGENTTHRIIDERRGRTYLVDYVNHFQRYAGDDESPASEIVRGAFNYAYHTGDWQSVRDRWADLQAAGVGSYVKNNWIVQSRLNSGGDTYHDVIVGTAHMARMAGVLGKEKDFGLFSYLLTRHLLAYYGFEYACLQHARKYEPWFITLIPGEMLVWDIYGPFGGMFTPYEKAGFYGPYSGFFEHYYRMDGDIMPRFYQTFLKDHMVRIFDKMVTEHVPAPPANDASKWALLFLLRSRFLGQDAATLQAWLDKSAWKGKAGPEALTALYDARNPRKTVEILNPALSKGVTGVGIHLQSDGLQHFNLDLDAATQPQPGVYWFGFNAINSNVKAAHGGNTIVFGLISCGDGQVADKKADQPNWVTWSYGWN